MSGRRGIRQTDYDFFLKISLNNKMLVLLFSSGTATANKETQDFSMSNLFSRECESVAASSVADQTRHNRTTDEAYSEVNHTSCYQLKGDVCWADYILNRILMKYVAFFPTLPWNNCFSRPFELQSSLFVSARNDFISSRQAQPSVLPLKMTFRSHMSLVFVPSKLNLVPFLS